VGTVLVISHDRYFLDKVVDRIVELRTGNLTEFLGGYTDYLAEVNE
jgi:ATPase subunit of ABC transporter with duplicated ATPase domains